MFRFTSSSDYNFSNILGGIRVRFNDYLEAYSATSGIQLPEYKKVSVKELSFITSQDSGTYALRVWEELSGAVVATSEYKVWDGGNRVTNTFEFVDCPALDPSRYYRIRVIDASGNQVGGDGKFHLYIGTDFSVRGFAFLAGVSEDLAQLNSNFAGGMKLSLKTPIDMTMVTDKSFDKMYDPVTIHVVSNSVTLKSHVLNNVIFDTPGVSSLYVDHTHTFNSEIFFANTETNRMNLPINVFSNWGDLLSVDGKKTVTTLPALVKLRQPCDGVGIIEIKEMTDSYQWTPSVTSCNLVWEDFGLTGVSRAAASEPVGRISSPNTFKIYGKNLQFTEKCTLKVYLGGNNYESYEVYVSRATYSCVYCDKLSELIYTSPVSFFVVLEGSKGEAELEVLP